SSVHEHARTWRDKRQPVNVLDRASQDLIVGEVRDGYMERIVQIEVSSETFNVLFRNFFHVAIDLAQGFQLSGILQSFGCEAGRGAFQDASGLNCVPDIGNTEFVRGKAGMRKRFDQTLMLQFLESQTQRCPGNAK